jgi:hypothetical protein
LPLQQHFYGISRLKLHTLKLYLYGKYSIQTMIFWYLCAFVWFKNIEKTLLQMTSGFLQLESTLHNIICVISLINCMGCVQVGGIRGLGDTSARSGSSRNHWFAYKGSVYMTVQSFFVYNLHFFFNLNSFANE